MGSPVRAGVKCVEPRVGVDAAPLEGIELSCVLNDPPALTRWRAQAHAGLLLELCEFRGAQETVESGLIQRLFTGQVR